MIIDDDNVMVRTLRTYSESLLYNFIHNIH